VYAGDVEAVEYVVAEDFDADERQVEVARAGAVCVEGRAVVVAHARDGTPAQDDGSLGRDGPAHDFAELLEASRVAAEGELDDALAHLVFAHASDDLAATASIFVRAFGLLFFQVLSLSAYGLRVRVRYSFVVLSAHEQTSFPFPRVQPCPRAPTSSI
jgi:hypothetical protein